jgi:transcriptional regulator with XRE-family HTH domain
MTKKEILNRLQEAVSKEPSKWHEDAQFRSDNKKWIRRSQAVALNILRTLRSQGLSQKELAEKMGVSAQLINRWVKGKENFTFETISKLEDALNIELIGITNYVEFEASEIQQSMKISGKFLCQEETPEMDMIQSEPSTSKVIHLAPYCEYNNEHNSFKGFNTAV